MEKAPNPYVYKFDLGGILAYRGSIDAARQLHMQRLQANRPHAILFNFASLQALIRKYGGNTTVQDAFAREVGNK